MIERALLWGVSVRVASTGGPNQPRQLVSLKQAEMPGNYAEKRRNSLHRTMDAWYYEAEVKVSNPVNLVPKLAYTV